MSASLNHRNCATEAERDCWGTLKDIGRYYATASGVRVTESCLVKSDKKFVKSWDPEFFLSEVSSMIEKQNTCLADLNPETSAAIKKYIVEQRPLVLCVDPDKADSSGDACGVADVENHTMYFVRTEKCGFPASTLFHEMLHLVKFDNLPTNLHNDNGCIGFDAVFTCTRMCFPEESFMQPIEKDGCEACIGTPDKHARCSKYPRRFTTEYMDCVEANRAPSSYAGPKHRGARRPGN